MGPASACGWRRIEAISSPGSIYQDRTNQSASMQRPLLALKMVEWKDILDARRRSPVSSSRNFEPSIKRVSVLSPEARTPLQTKTYCGLSIIGRLVKHSGRHVRPGPESPRSSFWAMYLRPRPPSGQEPAEASPGAVSQATVHHSLIHHSLKTDDVQVWTHLAPSGHIKSQLGKLRAGNKATSH